MRLRLLSDGETTRLVSDEDTAAAFKAAADKKKAVKSSATIVPDLRLIARVTLVTLLRLSEVLPLTRGDIGLTELTVVNSKNGRSRKVPIPADLRTLLLARCHASGSVFGLTSASCSAGGCVCLACPVSRITFADTPARRTCCGMAPHLGPCN